MQHPESKMKGRNSSLIKCGEGLGEGSGKDENFKTVSEGSWLRGKERAGVPNPGEPEAFGGRRLGPKEMGRGKKKTGAD